VCYFARRSQPGAGGHSMTIARFLEPVSTLPHPRVSAALNLRELAKLLVRRDPLRLTTPSPSFMVCEPSISAGMGSGLVDDCCAALTPAPQQRVDHANQKIHWKNY
jgi:hypothetical protein